jgi:diguanylate cyclase (GGDEF)-like protein
LLPGQEVTASFGIAKLTSTDVEAWFKQADEALYQAKAAGRNTVVEAA